MSAFFRCVLTIDYLNRVVFIVTENIIVAVSRIVTNYDWNFCVIYSDKVIALTAYYRVIALSRQIRISGVVNHNVIATCAAIKSIASSWSFAIAVKRNFIVAVSTLDVVACAVSYYSIIIASSVYLV